MASPLVSALGKATANIGKMSGALTKLNPALMIVKGSLDMVGAALDRNAAYLNEGVKINERLAITNQTYAEFSRKNTDALMGNTVGFEKSSKILAEANIMGLEGQGLQRKQLIEAVGRMKITGQNTAALLGLTLKTEQTTLANAKNSESLALAITATAAQYGIAAEQIVKAVGKLDFTMQTATGAGPAGLQQLIVGITADNQKRGEQAAALLNEVSRMNLGDAIRTGIDTEFKAIRSGTITRQQFERMVDTLEGRMDVFGAIPGMEVETVQGALGLGAGQQALIRSLSKLGDEPVRQRQKVDGIAASLAAAQERAKSAQEAQAASLEGQIVMKEASIIANGFLDQISSHLMPVSDWAKHQIGRLAEAGQEVARNTEALQIQKQMRKASEELLKVNLSLVAEAERTANATEDGVRLQEDEAALRRMKESEVQGNLVRMMSARLGSNAEALLEQVVARLDAGLITNEEVLAQQRERRVDGMFRSAMGME